MFDDRPNIVDNPALHVFDGTLAGLIDASTFGFSTPLGRPLSLASFAANLYYSGESPFYFKLTNLAIHLINGVLVYLVTLRLWGKLAGSTADRPATWPALWAAGVWLLHPINLTPVLYVVQRMTALATLFTLAALLLYLVGRQSSGLTRWAAIAASLLVLWPLGVLSKETAFLLPLYILLCEWVVLRSFDAWGCNQRRIAFGVGFAMILGVAVAVWPMIEGSYLARDYSLPERLLTESRVLWHYIGQILFPLPESFSLHHDDITVSRDWFSPPTTAVAVLAWCVSVGLAVVQRWHRPWITFMVMWFLAGHVLESSVLGLEIAYEHRNYLPSLGVIIGAGIGVASVTPVKAAVVSRVALSIGALGLCGFVTAVRAAQWGNEYVRTQIESGIKPTSPRTHFDAAHAILERQLPNGSLSIAAYTLARTHFVRAAQHDPHDKAALAGILYLDCAYGEPKDSDVYAQFLNRLAHEKFSFGEQGFIQKLSDMLVHDLLCLDQNEVDALLSAALSNPTAQGRTGGMLNAVAMDYAFAKLGSTALARRYAVAAVESDPGNPVLRLNLVRLLIQMGETGEARTQYDELRALPLTPHLRQDVADLGRLVSR